MQIGIHTCRPAQVVQSRLVRKINGAGHGLPSRRGALQEGHWGALEIRVVEVKARLEKHPKLHLRRV